MSVRVRYAPSPTGLQHIGGIRTALFNYFFARASQGTFILRVEDTDRARTTPESMDDLISTFEWLDIMWDEGPGREGAFGPYVQSERKDLYLEYIEKLLDLGHVYRCFCSEERVEQVREIQRSEKRSVVGYDRHCRDLSAVESSARAEAGEPFVIRFKVPLTGETTFVDMILGEITRKNEDINPDPVLIKRDGFPTYHFANVIDDHLMEISHIIRGQEWISSGPLHVLIYGALDWTPPAYHHLPMVLGTDGKKLGKRHGSTSIREFRSAGYLPEALINHVSLVGWSFDDAREFFSKEDLEKLFNLDNINKSPAVFDYKKLDWFNGAYIREKPDDELITLLIPYLQSAGIIGDTPSEGERKILAGAIPLIKERLKTLSEVPELVRFLFQEVKPESAEIMIPKKMDLSDTLRVAEAMREFLPGFSDRDDDANEVMFREKAEELGVKLGSLLMPLRVAISGSTVSPPLIESMRLLGEDKTLKRLDNAIRMLKEEG